MSTKKQLQKAMQTQDPKSAFLGQMQRKAGINPFGTTDYNNWLQNDAFGMVDSLYGMAIQRKPSLTRAHFNRSFFKNPEGANYLSPQGYAPYAAQANPRDYYNMQAQNAGININGVSPFEKFIHDQGYQQAADAYGAANQKDPKTSFFQFMKPGRIKTTL